jgi:hypothetical protein
MPRLILIASLKALSITRAVMLAAGLAALTATAAGWLMALATGSQSQWTGPVQVFALEIALAFLLAAFGWSALLPSPSAVDARSGRDGGGFAAATPALVLAVLAALALLQTPALVSWWSVDRALLIEAMGTSRDPMGLRLIPTVILLSLPALAAAALAAFVLTSLAGMLVRQSQLFRVLAACVLVQAGLVAGGYLILRATRTLGGTVQLMADRSADATAVAQISSWLFRHDLPAHDVSVRLAWLLSGYLAAVVVAAVVSRGAAGPTRADG